MKKNRKMRFGIVIIAALFIYFSYVVVEQERILKSKYKEFAEVQNTIEEEKKLQLRLDEQKKAVDMQGYVEEAARKHLGLVEDGEKVFTDTNK